VGKLVVLELEGSLSNGGFRVRLQMGEDGKRPDLDVSGFLPSQPDLAQLVESHWLEQYRPLGLPNTRGIKPKGIKYDGVLSRIKACKESGDQLCDRLNQWLSSPDFRAIDTQIRERLNYSDRIRFIVRTNCNDLHKLPWHSWQLLSRYTHAEISFSDTNFRRSDPLSTTPPGKVRILAILGHKEGIDTEKDRHTLDSLPNAEVTFLIEPKQAEINDQLWEQPWDILFFAGHSETDGDTGKIYINPNEYLAMDDIWYGLRKAVAQGLKLAIFNSCDGLGLARRLDDPHIPQMIVMRDYVPDLVAQKFLKSFLLNFSQGYSFEVAVREAREKLQGLEDQIPCATWLPVIWQHPDYISPTWDELVGQSPPPHFSWQKALTTTLCISLAVTTVVMGVRYSGLLESMELKAFDRLMQQRPPEIIDSSILVIEATDSDTNDYGYPLSDRILAETLTKILPHNPKVIGLHMHRGQPRDEGYPSLINLFNQHPNLISLCSHTTSEQVYSPPLGLSQNQIQQQLGFSDWYDTKSHDGVIRRQVLSSDPQLSPKNSECITSLSFSTQLALKFLELDSLEALQYSRLSKRAGGYQTLDGQSNQILINYRSPWIKQKKEIAKRIRLSEVIKGQFDPSIIQNKIVLITVTAGSAKDYYQTPYGEMAGVLIHAHMVSQIVHNIQDDRPLIWVLPQWKEVQWGDALWIFSWSLIAGSMVCFCPRKLWLLTLINIAMIFGLYQLCLQLLILGGWMPLIPSLLSMLIAEYTVVIYQKKANVKF